MRAAKLAGAAIISGLPASAASVLSILRHASADTTAMSAISSLAQAIMAPAHAIFSPMSAILLSVSGVFLSASAISALKSGCFFAEVKTGSGAQAFSAAFPSTGGAAFDAMAG